jgi:hypothetical protein
MTGSAKQSSFAATKQKAGLLRRFAPRNDVEIIGMTIVSSKLLLARAIVGILTKNPDAGQGAATTIRAGGAS